MAFAGVFSIIIGTLMVGQWAFFLARRQVPELSTEPVRLLFHLAAELATAILLLIGGFSLLTNGAWGPRLHPLSMGMLLYTLIASCGYFAQKRVWGMVGMFAILFAVALADLAIFFSTAVGN